MKSIARFAVAYPVTIMMMVLAVLLIGVISLRKLGMDLFPDLNNPRLFITLTSGELPPEEIEQQFVTSLEATAVQQEGAVGVSSVCRTGAADITVEYAWGTDMSDAFLELQRRISSQSGSVDELTVSQHDPNSAPILLIGFAHKEITDLDDLRATAEASIRNELVRSEGIADVSILGEETKEIRIETDPYRMEAFGVSSSTIASRIQEFNRSVSGGSIEEMGVRYSVRGISTFNSLEDFENLIITTTTTQATGAAASTAGSTFIPVLMKDVAKVSLVTCTPDNIVRINGKRSLALAVYKETRFNTVQAVEAVLNRLNELKRTMPDYEITIIQNQGSFIAEAIGEVNDSAVMGIILAVIILFAFLRRLGPTLIIGISIPLSIIATFAMMYFKGLSLNIMTLGGLALGAGMLVDNAIVVVESIFRNREQGLSSVDAAVEGASQVGGAVTSSTLTTIVVFFPIVYLHGSAGELFRDQAWTVAFSLMASLAAALMVIPMLASRFLGKADAKPSTKVRFPRYRSLLNSSLNHKGMVLLLSLALMVGGWFLIPMVGSEFMPMADRNDYSLSLTLTDGTTLERTEQLVDTVEAKLRSLFGDRVTVLASIVGPSGLRGKTTGNEEGEHTAEISLSLGGEPRLNPRVAIEAMSRMLAEIPNLDATVTQEQTALEQTLGSTGAPLMIDVVGEDLDVLQDITSQVMTAIQPIPDLGSLTTSFDEGRPEVNIVLDRTRAALDNLTIDTIGSQITTLLAGTTAGQWETGGTLRDIQVRLPDLQVSSLDDIAIERSGSTTMLSEVAQVTIIEAPATIYRENQSRIGRISATLDRTRPLDKVVGDINAAISGIPLPSGYKFLIGGEEQKRRESFGNLQFALILSLVLVYMVMASQFESLVHPFTIILTVPLAGVGAVLTFLLLGKPFSIMAYIGLIMLAGIAVNNAIILIDRVLQLQRGGLDTREAILEAGQQRLRPILMTSLTTILALTPMAIGIGEGAALRTPMALAVIGGLTTSTLLTLVVIPCVFYTIELMRPKSGRQVRHGD